MAPTRSIPRPRTEKESSSAMGEGVGIQRSEGEREREEQTWREKVNQRENVSFTEIQGEVKNTPEVGDDVTNTSCGVLDISVVQEEKSKFAPLERIKCKITFS